MPVAFIKDVALFTFFVVVLAQCFLAVDSTCIENSKKRVANLLDDIEEFYNQKFSVECTTNQRLLMKVAVNPSFLDFGSHPLSNPKRLEVTLKNVDSIHPFEIVATFGTHGAFVWSKFNQTLVAPLSTASFNVTFLPYKIGAFEGNIYISTSRGQLKYQVFGAAYVSTDHLIPIAEIDYEPTGSAVVSLLAYNPYPYHIQVGSVTLFVPPDKSPNPDSQINNETGQFFRIEQTEPLLLVPHQTTTFVTFQLPVRATSCVALISYCHNASCTFANCLKHSCLEFTMISSGAGKNRQLDALPQIAMLPARYTAESKLLSRTSLLHFGTVSQTTGPVTKPIELMNLLKSDVTIRRLEVDVLDPTLSLNLSVRTVPAESYTPVTVGTLTVTPEYVSRSRVLTGFLTVFAGTQIAMVKIPFYAKVVHGSLVVQERIVKPTTEPLHFQFDYTLSNQADVPISVMRPHLLSVNRGLIGTYRHPCLAFVQPQSEIVLLSLTVRNDSVYSRISGNLLISTNMSTFEVPFDVYSGHLEMHVENAHLTQGVYDFGTVLVNQQGSNTITLYNRNPMELEIEAFYVTTLQNREDAWQAVSAQNRSSSSCATMCLVFGVNETCVSCVSKLAAGQSSTLALFWGGLPEPVTKTGFIVLKSTYQRLIRPFRFSITKGRLSMLPNPMIVKDMFPGKIVRRNVIVQSSYSDPVELTRLQLEPADSAQSDITDGFVQLYRLPVLDQATSDTQEGAKLVLEPNRPTIVATVLFDPARACVDVLSALGAGASMMTSSWSREFNDIDHLPICHTGFSLDTVQGSHWLHSMTVPEPKLNSDTLRLFRSGLLQSAATYTQLRSAWMDQVTRHATSHPSVATHSLETFFSLGTGHVGKHAVDESPDVFWADLSASLVWPRLVSASRRKQPMVKRSVSICSIRASSSSAGDSIAESDSTTLEQALRAHFPPTIPGHSAQCDLIVNNPSDRPLVLQPILLDAVYAIRSRETDNETAKTVSTLKMRHEPLVSFLHALGVQASTEHVSKLTQLLTGSFHIQVVNSSQTTSSVYHELDAPTCCPIFLLPPSVGQVVLRLTFTPDDQHPSPFVVAHSSHNLLFLRNNLTALEPLWLNARLGKASLSLGTITPGAATDRDDSDASVTTEETINSDPVTSKMTVESVTFLVRAEWNTTETDDQIGTFDNRMSGSLHPIGCWIPAPVSPTTTQFAVETPTEITFNFDFGERALWPFCAETSDPELVYTFPDHIHSDLVHSLTTPSTTTTTTTTKTASPTVQMSYSIGHRGEVLSSLSLRRRLVLVNSGDVPVEIRAIMLFPDVNPPASFRAGDPDSGSHIKNFACFHRGFRVHPCFRYTPTTSIAQQNQQKADTTTASTITNNHSGSNVLRNETIHLAPGEQLMLEIRYRPDFVYTETSARLWIVAHPQNSPPPNQTVESILDACLGHQSDTVLTAGDHAACVQWAGLFRLTEIRLHAVFPSGFLRLCLNALPRPWIEYLLWVVVMFLFIVNLLGVIFMGSLDANRLYAAHTRAQQRLDRLAQNGHLDPDRLFRFDRLLTDPFAPTDTNPTADQVAKSKCASATSVDSPAVSQSKKDQSSAQSSRDALVPTGPSSHPNPVEQPSKSKPMVRSPVVTHTTASSQRSAATSGVAVTKSTVTDAGKDDGIFSNSDEEPWIVSRSSAKVSVSKSQTTGTSCSLVKLSNAVEDRKMPRTGRKSDFSKTTSNDFGAGATSDRNTARSKKKLGHHLDDTDDRESHSPTERGRTIEDDQQDQSASVLSPLRRNSRKSTSSSGTAATHQRSKISDAPKTEADIAAAVRATMRLAEETGSQARRKLVTNVTGAETTTSTRQRGAACPASAGWTGGREKRNRLSGGHSSTSSSSGPDQDTGPRDQPVGRQQQNRQTQQQSQLLPPQAPRASPVAVGVKRMGRNVFGAAVNAYPAERQSSLYNRFEQSAGYDNMYATYLGRQLINSDFQSTTVPHQVYGTSLDLDFRGDFIPDLVDTHVGPHLGLCWPASPMLFDQNQSLANNAVNVHFPPDSFSWPPPPPSAASANHWDEAVAEISTAEIWSSSPTANPELEPRNRLTAQEAMERIAADSLAFAASLVDFSPVDDADNNHHRRRHRRRAAAAAAAFSSMGRLDRSKDCDTRFVAMDSDATAGSSCMPPALIVEPPSPEPQGHRTETASDTLSNWSMPTSIIESLIEAISQSSPTRDDPTHLGGEPGDLNPFSSASRQSLCTTIDDDVLGQAPLIPSFLTSTTSLTNTEVNSCDTEDSPSNDLFSPKLPLSPSHYFYELPQITLARRLSMLQHEGRRDEITVTDATTTLFTTITTSWLAVDKNDNLVDNNQQTDSVTTASPPRRHGSKRYRSKSSTTTVPAANSKRPNTLPGLAEAQHQSSTSGPPSFGMDRLASDPTAATANSPSTLSQVHAGSREVQFQPWQPVNSISKADLFMDLGLDDTDQLLPFGPDFSYHQQGTTTSDTDCITPVSQQIPSTNPVVAVGSQQDVCDARPESNPSQRDQPSKMMLVANLLPRTTVD